MDPEFPFKLEVRNNELLNLRVHAHEHFQICYIRKGACVHSVFGKEVELVKGNIFSIPPFMEHRIKPMPNQEVELVQIDFMLFFINDLMRDISSINEWSDFAYIQPFVNSGDEFLPRLNLSFSNQIATEQLIASMQHELASKDEGFKLAIKADLLKLLVIIGREYKKHLHGLQEKRVISMRRKEFYDAIGYLQNNYNRQIKLEDVADRVAMAPTYFSRVFKAMMGKTFVEYMNELRIREAMNLLKHSEDSITEICLNVGFNHLGHFNRMFKKMTGITPKEYRKQAAGENRRQ
jgi:AraC-like DNA-binding protein